MSDINAYGRGDAWALGDKQNWVVGTGTGKDTILYTPGDFAYREPLKFENSEDVLVSIIGRLMSAERINLHKDGHLSYFIKDQVQVEDPKPYIEKYWIANYGNPIQEVRKVLLDTYFSQVNNLASAFKSKFAFPYETVYIKNDELRTRRAIYNRLQGKR